jgi:hypothetical protein
VLCKYHLHSPGLSKIQNFKATGRRQRISIAAALTLGTCAASAAHVDVSFCNNYTTPVFVSVAYNENGEWISKGWEKVESTPAVATRSNFTSVNSISEPRSIGILYPAAKSSKRPGETDTPLASVS